MINALTGILALTPPAGDGQQPSAWVQFVPFILIFLIFYFLIFAPMRKKQKKHQEMVQNLRAGDRVITNGGLYGTVVGVTDHVIQLRVADQVKIDVAKHAVSAMQADGYSAQGGTSA